MTRIIILILAGVLATPALAGGFDPQLIVNELMLLRMQQERMHGGEGFVSDNSHYPWRRAEVYCQSIWPVFRNEEEQTAYRLCVAHYTVQFAR